MYLPEYENKIMHIISGIILSALLSISTVCAGTITLEQTASASILGNTLSVEIKLLNQGDMPATNITPSVFMLGERLHLSGIPTLNAGQSYSQTTSASMGDDILGEYHILSLISYDDDQGKRHITDAQLYLNSTPIDEHPISLTMITKSSQKTEKRLTLIIKNNAERIIPVNLQFITPDDVAVNHLPEIFSLNALAENSFPIILNSSNFENFSDIPLYVITRYTINEVQHSQLISAQINPKKQESPAESFFSKKILLLSLAGFFILLLIITSSRNLFIKTN